MNVFLAFQSSIDEDIDKTEKEISDLVSRLQILIAHKTLLQTHKLINGLPRQSKDNPVERHSG